MNGILRNKLMVFVFVLIVVSVGYIFAADVTVQEGALTVDSGMQVGSGPVLDVPSTIESNIEVNTGLEVSGMTYADNGLMLNNFVTLQVLENDSFYFLNIDKPTAINSALINSALGVLDSENDVIFVANSSYVQVGDWDSSLGLWVYDYLDVGACIGYGSGPDGYFSNLYANKLTCGSIDPPYVLYDQQSREEVIDKIKKEVPPDKQTGAALFFNKETKKLETYVASEGKFYDIEGNLIYELTKVVEPTTKYETVYRFDNTTGNVKPVVRPIQEKFQFKEGYALDDKTGNIFNKNTNQIVTREEALEIYVASEGKIYDLDHNFVRNAEKGKNSDIFPAGNRDSSYARINSAQNNNEKQETAIKPASLHK